MYRSDPPRPYGHGARCAELAGLEDAGGGCSVGNGPECDPFRDGGGLLNAGYGFSPSRGARVSAGKLSR